MKNSVLFYNPSCSKCRQTKTLLDEQSVDFELVEYLQNPPDKNTLMAFIEMGIPAAELVRTAEDEWKSLDIDINNASNETVIEAILKFPKIMQRPILVNNGKATLGRPPEKVLEIL